MRFKKRFKQLFIISFFLYPICFCVQQWNSIGTVSSIIPLFDSRLSCAAQDAISEHIVSYKQQVYNPAMLLMSLKEKFPVIESATLRAIGDRTGLLHIQSCNPLVVVNETQILAEGASIVSALMFEATIVDRLKSIYVADLAYIKQPYALEPVIKGYLQQGLLDQYRMTFYDVHTVSLHTETNESVTLICDGYAVPDQKVCDMCTQCVARVACGEHITGWVADVRFKDQIIVKRGKGGHHDKV